MEVITDIKASNSPITSTPLIADINGDKNIEIVYTNIQDSIQVLNTNVKTIKNLRIWPMFLANAQHTSEVSLEHFKKNYMKMIIFGIVLFILLIFIKIRGIIKKSKKRVKVIYL
jgi:lipoate synthase